MSTNLEKLIEQQEKLDAQVAAAQQKRAELGKRIAAQQQKENSKKFALLDEILSGKQINGEDAMTFINRAIDKKLAEAEAEKKAKAEKKASDSSKNKSKKDKSKDESVSTSTPETKNNSAVKEQAESSNLEKKVETKGSQAEKPKAYAGVPF